MAAMPVAELHVVPHAATGGWTIASGAGPVWFATLGEAQEAALSQAGARDTPVFLHDRYHRVRKLVARDYA
jgi:hypothetical protein